MGDRTGRAGGGTEMLVILPKQELVGHAGNIIAHDDMTRIAASHLLKGIGHRAQLLQIESKKLFEAMDGALAVFGNHRMIVNVREQELLQLVVLRAPDVAKAAQASWSEANVIDRTNAGLFDKPLGIGNQIADEQIDNLAQRVIELELHSGARMSGLHLEINLAEE